MLSSLGKLSTETKEIKAQIRKMAQDKLSPSLKEAFSDLKKVVPTLEAIRWTQYTPHFNDGDECTFGLHGVYFRVEGLDSDSGDHEDGFESSWGLKNSNLSKTQIEALDNFEDELGNVDDLLQEALGDHTQVTLTATGIETEEYSHD